MSSDLAKLVVELQLEKDGYKRGLYDAEEDSETSARRSENKVGGAYSRMGGLMGTAVKAGAAVGVVAVEEFVRRGVLGAANLAESVSKVGVVFGPVANQVTGFADEMADKFGLPKQSILDAAASIGLIGKASGLAQPEAAKMSTQLAKLAADASSFYNVPLEEALAAIQSGLVGEAEPMRRFGVLLNEQAVDAEAARLGLAKVGKEYSEGAKAQARASLIMAGMKDASGDLERTQDSLANRLREVKGRAENMATAFGTLLVPWVLKGFDALEALGGAAKRLAAPLADAGRRAVEMAAQAKEAFTTTLGGGSWESAIPNPLARLAVMSAKQVPAIKGAFTKAQDAIGFSLDAIEDGLKGRNFETTNPVYRLAYAAGRSARQIPGIASDAVAAFKFQYNEGEFEAHNPVESLAVGAARSVRKIQTLMSGVGKWIGDAIESVSKFIADNRRTWDQWGAKVEDIANQVGGALSAAWALIKGVFTQGVEIVSNLWDRFGGHLWSHVKVAIDAVLQVVGGAFEILKGVLNVFAAIFTGDWKRLWEGVKQILGGVWDVLVGIVRTGVNLISTAIGAAMALISAAWGLAWHSLQTVVEDVMVGVKSAFGAVFGWIGDRIGEIVGWFQAIPGRLSSFVGAMFDGVRNAFGSVFGWIGERITEMVGWFRAIPGRLGGFIGGIFDGLTNAARAAFNAVASFWNNTVGKLSFRAPDWVPFIGGMGWDVPDIPLLAKGADVVGRGLAIVGDDGPELLELPGGARVSPLSKSERGLVAAGVDERLLARAIASEVARALGGGQPVVLKLDGREVGRGILPWIRDENTRATAAGSRA